LIFVEVALLDGMAANVHDLLDENAPVLDPERADTAIFYSISNAQKGLAGISFGNFLIKRVADTLAAEFPNLKAFATLSPVPGFRAWLDERLSAGDKDLLTPGDRKALAAAAERAGGGIRGSKGLLKALVEAPDWPRDEITAEALRGPLMRLCANYLINEKRAAGDIRTRDPVAHFHLSNGARMERLNWMGDRSDNGLAQSAGIMINYLYKLSDVEANHEAYRATGKVTASSAMRALLKG